MSVPKKTSSTESKTQQPPNQSNIPQLSTQNKSKKRKILISAGYINNAKIADALQGSVWRSTEKSTNQSVVIKVISKQLFHHQKVLRNGQFYYVKENISKERNLLKYLSSQNDVPNSIIKYHHFFKSNLNYYLVMEDGGNCLFDFTVKAHNMILHNMLDFSEWHKMVKYILNQILNAIEFIHSHNICHFDVSLENICISDIDIQKNNQTNKVTFILNNVTVKLCDFGLAEMFTDINNKCLTDKYCGKPNYRSPEIVNQKKLFNAKSNDVWCVGVCLFILLIGGLPWKTASNNDDIFHSVIHGGIPHVLNGWNRSHYVNAEINELLVAIFKYEDDRISLAGIKQSKWLQTS